MQKFCYLQKWFNKDKGKEQLAMKLTDFEFEWSKLSETALSDTKDMRFTLYDVNTNRTLCTFFDIDNVTYDDREAVADIVYQTVGTYEAWYVDSGGGVHVYFPMSEGYASDEMQQRRDSYLTVCETIDKAIKDAHLTGECDKGVFCAKKCGRMVGGINSKNNSRVELIYNVEGEEIPKDYFKPTKNPTKKQIKLPDSFMSFYPEEVLKHCRAIQHFKRNAQDYANEYELRLRVATTMVKVGKGDDYHKLYPTDEGKFDHVTNLNYSCGSIEGAYKSSKLGHNPCKGCPHRKGGFPAYISGALPTPSRSRGFIDVDDKDKRKMQHDDITNHYVNTSMGKVRFIKGTKDYFYYDGKSWSYDCGKNLGEDAGGVRLWRDLFGIPIDYPSTENKLKLLKSLKVNDYKPVTDMDEFNTKNLIAFSNCVFNLDLETKTITKGVHHPQNMNLTHIDCDYEEGAEAPVFEEFLEYITGGDQIIINLLKIIMGLTVSNLQVRAYGKFFWLWGASGSGKSTFTQVLQQMVGNDRVAMVRSGLLTGDKSMPSLISKSLFLGADIIAETLPKGGLKKFCGLLNALTDEGLFAERIVHKPTQNINIVSTPIFTANPAFQGVGVVDGIERRVIPIQFRYVPEAENRNLNNQIWRERKGLYRIAMEGLQMFIRDGFSEYLNSSKYREEMAHIIDNSELNDHDEVSLRAFLEEKFEVGGYGDTVESKQVYSEYETYIQMSNMALLDSKAFYRVISQDLKMWLGKHLRGLDTTKIKYNVGGKRGYRFLKFKQ